MNAIEITDLRKQYAHKDVLKNLSLTVKAGETLGLLGSNGAGKTTLLKVIAGLSRPDAGDVKIFGLSAGTRSRRVCQFSGLVTQENNIERELSIRESLLLYARLYNVANAAARVDDVICQFDMESWADKTVEEVSGGMARRAMIARAILPAPRLLLLDEPSVGLDPDMRREVWTSVDKLRQAGTTIVITTHYMEEAEQLCSRVALLKDGVIAHLATVEEIKRLVAFQAGQSSVSLETAFLHLVHREAV